MLIKLKAAVILLFIFVSSSFADVHVMCSSFPVYDFARAIVGTSGHVRLLLRPGTEPHEFEPSMMDIKDINDYDVFVYTGKYLEHWAEKISRSINKDIVIIDASKNIELVNNDPHIWLDGINASSMLMNIFMGIIQADKLKADYYSDNLREYLTKLHELDGEFMSLPRNKAIVFAGEFSLGYFVRRYGLDYISAYDGENEPGARKIAQVIKYIRDNNVKYIFSDYEVSAITRSIADQTGAEILIFNTGHAAGESDDYLEIMKQNLENLKLALND